MGKMERNGIVATATVMERWYIYLVNGWIKQRGTRQLLYASQKFDDIIFETQNISSAFVYVSTLKVGEHFTLGTLQNFIIDDIPILFIGIPIPTIR